MRCELGIICEPMDNTEEHRHKCECRFWLAQTEKRGMEWFRDFVRNFKRWPDSKLQADYSEQYRRGNKGEWGDWR